MSPVGAVPYLRVSGFGALGWVCWVSRGQRSNLDLPTLPLYLIGKCSGSLCVVTLHCHPLVIKRPRSFRHVRTLRVLKYCGFRRCWARYPCPCSIQSQRPLHFSVSFRLYCLWVASAFHNLVCLGRAYVVEVYFSINSGGFLGCTPGRSRQGS